MFVLFDSTHWGQICGHCIETNHTLFVYVNDKNITILNFVTRAFYYKVSFLKLAECIALLYFLKN